MSADIKVLQGNQIGGCITVISTNKTKIVIDYGESLPGSGDGTNINLDWEKEKVNAVFFTHYHGDHIGRFMEIPDDVPIYMGEVTYDVMLNIRDAIKDEAAVNKLKKRLEIGTIFFVERNTPITINNDIVVTGYDVDHSAFDAFMYLIEADGTNILHTGDFRDHGHRGHVKKNGRDINVILEVIKHYVKGNGRKVDVLIIEGTMMDSRVREPRFSEKDLYAWAKAYFKDHRYIFLKISSTNVDSLASFCQAAKDNGITMYANGYIRKQFGVYREAGKKHGTTMYDFPRVKPIRFISDKPGYDNQMAYENLDEMRKNGFVLIVGEYDHYERLMDELMDCNPDMIYSMWGGYINPNLEAYNESLARFCRKYNAFSQHTSGHAFPELIEQVIREVNPTQMIWPIHTENVEAFRELDIPDELKGKINMYGLSNEEIEILENMEDHRYISHEEDGLEKAFITGGLSEFRKFVINHNKSCPNHEKLSVMLRGNDNSIIIYKNNHKLWELSEENKKKGQDKKEWKVQFDYDHARYSEKWKDTLITLMKSPYNFKTPAYRSDYVNVPDKENNCIVKLKITRRSDDNKSIIGGEIGIITANKKDFSYRFVEDTYKIFNGLISEFFTSTGEDQFRKEIFENPIAKGYVKPDERTGANVLVEKRWQQRIFFQLKNMKDGYYAYDSEFSQKYPDADTIRAYANKNGPQYAIVTARTIKNKLGTNEPDLLAIRYENSVPKALVLIEVKSTKGACVGKSDIKKHMKGMHRYSDLDFFMKKRRTDAYESLCQYQRMGFIDSHKKIEKLPDELPIERLLIFTNNAITDDEPPTDPRDSARWYFDHHIDAIHRWAEEYKCEVWIATNNYTNEYINFNCHPFDSAESQKCTT